MIKIKLEKNNDKIKNIIIKGHALYDDYGKDIVCAGVSSCIITSVNASLLIDENSLSYDDKEGLNIKVLKDDVVTEKIITNMVSNLYELMRMHPENIQIKEENNNEINGI